MDVVWGVCQIFFLGRENGDSLSPQMEDEDEVNRKFRDLAFEKILGAIDGFGRRDKISSCREG